MVVISPLFAVFEVVQLFVAQRYIGIEQIRRNAHPLDVVAAPTPWFSGLWLVCLGLDYLYQGGLLLMPEVGIKFAAVLMLMVSAAGFALRRVCGLRWGLVVMTPECAARAGFFMFVFNMMVLHGPAHTLPGLEWLYHRYLPF